MEVCGRKPSLLAPKEKNKILTLKNKVEDFTFASLASVEAKKKRWWRRNEIRENKNKQAQIFPEQI